jgi:hypothetical protein
MSSHRSDSAYFQLTSGDIFGAIMGYLVSFFAALRASISLSGAGDFRYRCILKNDNGVAFYYNVVAPPINNFVARWRRWH